MEVKWSGDYFSAAAHNGYEFVHENDMVLALPIVGEEYIIRREQVPSYSVKDETGSDRFWTMISGTVDEGESPLETLRREMGEETPILPNRVQIIDQQEQIPFVKLSDQRVSLYHFRVLDYEETEAEGDGTSVEENSTYGFVSYEELQQISNRPSADFTIQFAAALANPSDI